MGRFGRKVKPSPDGVAGRASVIAPTRDSTVEKPESSDPEAGSRLSGGSGGTDGTTNVYPFIPVSEDMAGLLVASWLTPTVRSPRKLLFPYVISILLQLGFIGYLLSFVIYQQPLSNLCATPAMLQFCAVYVFGVTMFSNHTSITNLQIALTCTKIKKVDGEPTIMSVRPTSRSARRLLACLPLADLLIEVMVLVVGIWFLMTSESAQDVVLNSVAVNFISEIDEMMLRAFVSPLTKQRLNKYHFEALYGVEEGATKKQHVNKYTLIQTWIFQQMPIIWMVGSLLIVAIGQLVALVNLGFALDNFSCTVILAHRLASDAMPSAAA